MAALLCSRTVLLCILHYTGFNCFVEGTILAKWGKFQDKQQSSYYFCFMNPLEVAELPKSTFKKLFAILFMKCL